MDEAVDSVFDFDESAKLGQVANSTFDGRAHRVLIMQSIPGVRGELTHA